MSIAALQQPNPSISPAVDSRYRAVMAEAEGRAEYPARITAPPEGWLSSYVDYASACTDAPRIYHVACGLTLLGAAAGNKVFLRRWGAMRFLNLWTILVGRSTTFRKTTSIHLARDILRQSLPNRIYSHSWSVEALQGAMTAHPAGLIEAGELAALTTEMQRDYNKGAMPLLTRLYDGETYTRQTVKEGVSSIQDPAPSLLAASTPDWLAKGMKVSDTEAGWLPRMFLVVANKKELDRHNPPAGVEQYAAGLAEGLLIRSRREGEIKTNPASEHILRDFADFQMWQQENGQYPAEYAPFYARRQTDALKIAALLCLSQKVPTWEIGPVQMTYAVDLIKATTPAFVRVLSEEISYSRIGEHVNLIRRRLREAPNVTLGRNELVRKIQHSMSTRELDLALETLLQGELVETIHLKAEGRGRPPLAYRLKELG